MGGHLASIDLTEHQEVRISYFADRRAAAENLEKLRRPGCAFEIHEDTCLQSKQEAASA